MTGYKTIAFAVLTFLIAVAGFFGFGGWEMPVEWQQWYNLLIPVVFAILRVATKTAVFKKD